MHLYAVVFVHDPLLMLLQEERARETPGVVASPKYLADHGFIEFFWADDPNHAIEQAADAHADVTTVPTFSALVPDEYVRQPIGT